MKPSNPFNPNSVVTPTLFAGRSSQVLQILRKLTQVREGMPASFVLQGERGIGKTALAKLIMYIAEKNDPQLENLNFLTGYYTVEKGQKFETVLQSCLNMMTDRMPATVIQRLTDRLGGFFKNGKFTIGAFGVSATYDGPQANDAIQLAVKDRAVSALSNIISGLAEAKEQERKPDGLLIVIDEIHNLGDLAGAAQILRAISTTLDVNQQGNMSFIIIGYPEGMEKFFAGDPSARRHFDVINLTVMPKNEAKEVLTKGFEKIKVNHDEVALDKNIDVAGGYPHSIQVIGHNLVESDTDQCIANNDWDDALKQTTFELMQKDFSDMYVFKGKATVRETVLNILALSGRPMSKQELSEATAKKNIYTDNCLGVLKKTGAIKTMPDGMLTLHSTLFRVAILMHVHLHAHQNATYRELIRKFTPSEK